MCSAFTFPKGFFSFDLYQGKTVKLDPFIAEIESDLIKNHLQHVDFLFSGRMLYDLGLRIEMRSSTQSLSF